MAKSEMEKKREKVIDVLNQARALELQAIHQYMNQHFNLDNMDYGEFAAKLKLIAIDEMRHSEMFGERIKELDGEPTAEPSGKTEKGQKVEIVFPFNANLEDHAITVYNQFLLTCRDNGDSKSARLFETIIDDEQVHLNYFEGVKEHIERLGEAYLAKIAGTPSTTGLAPQGFTITGTGA